MQRCSVSFIYFHPVTLYSFSADTAYAIPFDFGGIVM